MNCLLAFSCYCSLKRAGFDSESDHTSKVGGWTANQWAETLCKAHQAKSNHNEWSLSHCHLVFHIIWYIGIIKLLIIAASVNIPIKVTYISIENQQRLLRTWLLFNWLVWKKEPENLNIKQQHCISFHEKIRCDFAFSYVDHQRNHIYIFYLNCISTLLLSN